jgi:hypothetical protein
LCIAVVIASSVVGIRQLLAVAIIFADNGAPLAAGCQ